MAVSAPIESILVIDCGSTSTRAVLVDTVDGHYRFVARGEAPSTLSDPDDVMGGVQKAVSQIEATTGRKFVDGDGQVIRPEAIDGRGVDAVLVASSAAPPLRIGLAGLSDEISLASARRAVQSTYATVVEVLSPQAHSTAILERMGKTPVEAIVITGGTDGGPVRPVVEVVERVTLGCSLMPISNGSDRPVMLYAGNAALRGEIAAVVDDRAELLILDNVRPSLNRENLGPLSSKLEALYVDKKLTSLPGFHMLQKNAAAPILTSARAFGYVMKYLAQMWGAGHAVLGVDVGGASTVVASVVKGQFSLVRADLGVGQGIENVVRTAGLPNILRWLPFELDETSAHDRLMSKAVWSASVPQTSGDLFLEQAVAREALRLAIAEARQRWGLTLEALTPRFEAIVGTGGLLMHVPHHGQAALLLLDAIQPTGVTTIWLDETSLAVPVGAIALFHPTAMTQIMERDAFINLGTVVCPIGHEAHEGDIILRLTITYSDRRTLDVEISYGSLEIIPLPLGEQATLELRPLKGFDVGEGPGKKRQIRRLVGGMLGLVVDARGRPLTLPGDPAKRAARMRRWYSSMGS